MSTEHPVIKALRETTKLRPAEIDFIVENGRNYRGVSLPSGVRRWPPGQCVPGAREFEDRGLGRFVTGFVLRSGNRRPLNHSWVTPDGERAFDPTMADARLHAYWGLEERYHERLSAMIARGFRGVTSGGIPLDLMPGAWVRSMGL